MSFSWCFRGVFVVSRLCHRGWEVWLIGRRSFGLLHCIFSPHEGERVLCHGGWVVWLVGGERRGLVG
jgi:hypothetical protein